MCVSVCVCVQAKAMAITVISWRPTKFTCVCCRPTVCVWQTQLKWKFADLHKVSLRLVTCVLSQLTHKHTPLPRMQQLWPCIIRYLNSACGMPQHPLYWLNFHPTHRKEEGGEAGVGDVTNRQLALKIKSFSCLTRSRTCMERAGYMCEYSVRNTIQQASPYPDSSSNPNPNAISNSFNYNRNRRRDESHRASLGPDSNVSFMSMPRSPFPHSHSHSHCDSLLPFAFHIPLPLPFPALGFRFRCLAV